MVAKTTNKSQRRDVIETLNAILEMVVEFKTNNAALKADNSTLQKGIKEANAELAELKAPAKSGPSKVWLVVPNTQRAPIPGAIQLRTVAPGPR
jgi:hypothetical protein